MAVRDPGGAGAAGRAFGPAVTAADLLGPGEYARVRAPLQAACIALKRRRRVWIGPHVSVQFENRSTVLYWLHEWARAEGRWDAAFLARIAAEAEVLVPRPGDLRATVLICGGARADALALASRLAADPGSALAIRLGDRVARAEPIAPPPDAGCPVHYVRFAVGRDAVAALRDRRRPAVLALRLGPAGVHTAVSLPERTRDALAADLHHRLGHAPPGAGPTRRARSAAPPP